MRTKFLAALLLCVVLLLGVAACLNKLFPSSFPPARSVATRALPTESTPPGRLVPPLFPVASAPTNLLSPEQRQQAIEAEIDQLQEWSMKDDPASLANIVAAFASPDEEVRRAAIDAAKEFGSTNAIPALKNAADKAEDLREKIDFLEAADFLTIPPLSFEGDRVTMTPEQIQAHDKARSQRIARRQARSQSSPSTFDAPTTPPAPQ